MPSYVLVYMTWNHLFITPLVHAYRYSGFWRKFPALLQRRDTYALEFIERIMFVAHYFRRAQSP
jgi:hypothetical protein